MKKSFVPLIILICILVAGGIAALIYAKSVSSEQKQDEITPELTDEFSRIKWFIVDWYNELKGEGTCQVFLNELRFDAGKYTLTYAVDRIRAVYPRGERYFKLEQVNKIEFFQVNGVLRCRLYYGNNGEYLFRVN